MSTLSQEQLDEIVKKVSAQVIEDQAKKHEDEMKRMKDEIESLRRALDNKAESSGSRDNPPPKEDKKKDDEEKGKRDNEFSGVPFDYSQMGKFIQLPSINQANHPPLMESTTMIGHTR